MTKPDLDSILDQQMPELQAVDTTVLSEDQLKELTEQIKTIANKIETGGQATIEEERLIVVYFRARRQKVFSVVAAKTKPKKEKATLPKKRTSARTKMTTEQAEDLLNNMLGDLP